MKPKYLSIDLETRSEVDLGKCGVYKYVEGEDWKILLFCYAFEGDEDVRAVQMGIGEELPQDVLAALEDPEITKYAWNAAFERVNLSKYLGRRLDPRQWRCTMVWAAELSLPLSLEKAAAALHAEQLKDKAGKDLIRKFSVMQTDRKTKQPYWISPEDQPEAWAAFVEYCRQDVRTELSIHKRLERFPLPDSEWELYHIDQDINDRGVLLDMALVEAAMKCGDEVSDRLAGKARELTGLDNPNSVTQLKNWLSEHSFPMETLGKKEVEDALKEDVPKEARNMLELRLQMSKASVKKYEAAKRCACSDGRARGLFQFYGANRTGRFCLTGDHEVLTEKGWVRLDEWAGGKIACWTPGGEMVGFQNAKSLCFDYEGDMYDYEDVRISQISTPDHKMWCQRNYGGKWQTLTVEEMSKCCPVIPMCGFQTSKASYDSNKLRIILMTQADGFYTPDGTIAFNFRKQRKIERCKHLLRKEGIWFSESKYGNGYETTKIVIPRRYIPIWLRMFKTKELGWWLLDEDASVIFDELPFWDGSRITSNSIQYSTTNKTNADILQALAHINGLCASMVVKRNSQRNENWNDAYVLNIWEKPSAGHVITSKPDVFHYEGKVYCAETKTGYFLVRRNGKVWVTGNSGRHIQLQNLRRNSTPALGAARDIIKAGDSEMLEMVYGDPLDILSQCCRTMLVPKPGCEFIVADFSAIEARVIAWLAGEEWTLEAFREGKDLYCATASSMFGVPVEKHGQNAELRQKGKIAVLACGYGGGVGAMTAMGALDMGLTEDELPDIVRSYREANPNIVRFWWDLDNAATEAIRDHQTHIVGENNRFSPKKVSFEYYSGVLWMVLPSGRRLAYVSPRIGKNRFGGKSIEFLGVGLNNKWDRIETYGAKLSENCCSGDTFVLTNKGFVKIIDVNTDDLIWDGIEWVSHGGVVYKGVREVIELLTHSNKGIQLTPEHLIFTKEGWVKSVESERLDWAEVRIPDCCKSCEEQQSRESSLELSLCMRKDARSGFGTSDESEKNGQEDFMRMYAKPEHIRKVKETWDDPASGLRSLAQHDSTMHGAHPSRLEKLWRKGNHSLRKMGAQFRKLLGRYGGWLAKRIGIRSGGQRWRLLPEELQMGDTKRKCQEQANKYSCGFTNRKDDRGGIGGESRHKCHHAPVSSPKWLAHGITVNSTGCKKSVYDIRNCGPRHQFCVLDPGTGDLRLIHNCTQAVARDILCNSIRNLAAEGIEVVAHVHDECICEVPKGKYSVDDICRIMARNPSWCPTLPLTAAGYLAPDYYFKD